MATWLIEEGAADTTERAPAAPGAANGAGLESLAPDPSGTYELAHNLAIYLRPLEVLDTRKLFGDAQLRLDMLVVHGGSADGPDLYQAQTLRFPRVADGDDLSQADPGILVYYGRPKHFLALSVMLSRDRSDSADLAALISAQSKSPELRNAMGALGGLLVAAPQLAAVQVGVQAALAIGELAYKLVEQTTSPCLGLFRAGWLGNLHRFGIGRHPSSGVQPVKDFNLAYDIVVDHSGPAAPGNPT